jgi:hypothetical protein
MSFHVCPECGAENTSYHCDECGRIERTPEQIRLDVLVMQKSTALQTRLSALEAENERLRAKLDAERQVFKERLDELKRDAEHWRKWHDKKKTELDRAYAMAERVRVASGWDGTIDGVNHDVFVLNLRTERNTALSDLARVREECERMRHVVEVAQVARARRYSIRSQITRDDRVFFDHFNQAVDEYVEATALTPKEP